MVIAYEANPEVARRLLINTSTRSNIKVENLAASCHNGNITFYLDADTAKSSVLARNPSNIKTVVPCVRLDSTIQKRINFLKIDVEGHEYAVLRGASKLLSERKVDTIMFEVSADRNEIFHLLTDQGYKVAKTVRGGRLIQVADAQEIPHNSFAVLDLKSFA